MPNPKAKSPTHNKQAPPPALEWILGGIGVVLFVACVVFLIYEGIRREEQPGGITASVLDVRQAGEQHVVTFKLQNGGSQTLSNLLVSGRLLDGEREIERVSTTIDYLPGRSAQEGGFYFEHDPTALKLEIVPEGYQKP